MSLLESRGASASCSVGGDDILQVVGWKPLFALSKASCLFQMGSILKQCIYDFDNINIQDYSEMLACAAFSAILANAFRARSLADLDLGFGGSGS